MENKLTPEQEQQAREHIKKLHETIDAIGFATPSISNRTMGTHDLDNLNYTLGTYDNDLIGYMHKLIKRYKSYLRKYNQWNS